MGDFNLELSDSHCIRKYLSTQFWFDVRTRAKSSTQARPTCHKGKGSQEHPTAAAMASYRRSRLPFARPQTLHTLQNPPNPPKPSKPSKPSKSPASSAGKRFSQPTLGLNKSIMISFLFMAIFTFQCNAGMKLEEHFTLVFLICTLNSWSQSIIAKVSLAAHTLCQRVKQIFVTKPLCRKRVKRRRLRQRTRRFKRLKARRCQRWLRSLFLWYFIWKRKLNNPPDNLHTTLVGQLVAGAKKIDGD